MKLGLVQGIMLPHERPFVPALRQMGFTGTDAQVIASTAKLAPELLTNCASASAMWTANAATVSPSADTRNGKVHFTPANLIAMFHRSIEPEFTGRILRAIFPQGKHFSHHPPLPAHSQMGDEGAANHNRFCSDHDQPGLELFVFGRHAFRQSATPWKFPARQTFEASQALARSHLLNPKRVLFAQQNPVSIDAGAFHNDVVAVANQNVFFYHQQAYEDPQRLQEELRAHDPNIDWCFIEVPKDRVPLEDAVKSYIFNSQLVSLADKSGMALILPLEARETESTRLYLNELAADAGHPIHRIEYLDVRQSMRNGGGPACLRLRVVLNEQELAATSKGCILTKTRLTKLRKWANKYYREELEPADLADPLLLNESRTALDALSSILELGAIYDFQREGG